jgi:NADH:ubiquinone oxidoreductase subunit 6 (subunit J)
MRFSKPLIAAALAVSSLSTPVLAQSAAPLSIAARSGAVTKDSNELYNSYVLPAAVIIAVLAAAILISHHHHNDISNSP